MFPDPPKLKTLPVGAGLLAPVVLAKILGCDLVGSSWLAVVPPKTGVGVDAGAALTPPNGFLGSGVDVDFAAFEPKRTDAGALLAAPNSGLAWG